VLKHFNNGGYPHIAPFGAPKNTIRAKLPSPMSEPTTYRGLLGGGVFRGGDRVQFVKTQWGQVGTGGNRLYCDQQGTGVSVKDTNLLLSKWYSEGLERLRAKVRGNKREEREGTKQPKNHLGPEVLEFVARGGM